MNGQVKNLNCAISFIDNTDAVFFTGQTVSGTATLTLLKNINVRSVSITVTGSANTKWFTGGSSTRQINIGNEELLNSITVLMGAVNGPEFELPAGVYNYNFSCFLPPQLPTTLENDIGKIEYFVQVLVDRSSKSDDKFIAVFTVLRPLDLNMEPATIKHPCEMNENKTFCCCCCSYRGFNITSRIPQTGYIPGQTITVDAEIVNTSSVKLNRVNIILIKTFQFRSDQKTSTQQFHTLTKVRLANEDVMNRMNFKKHLVIPATPPSLTSKLIDIEYTVFVVGKISGCHINPCAAIPITIGTNALLGSYQQEPIPMAMPMPGYYNQDAGKSSFEKNDLPPSYNDFVTKS